MFRAHEAQLVEVCLSAQIWDEVIRNLRDTRRMTDAQIARLETAAQEFFALQGMLVEGYEPLVPSLTCDRKDRHVLAAAIQGRATTIVTVNLPHFPAVSLVPHAITAEHPDTFLARLHATRSAAVERLLDEQAAAKTRPPQTVEELLATLAVHVPRFVADVRAALSQPSA
jgi:hypothetical protein